MLDVQFIRKNPELVQEKSKQKGVEIDIDKFLDLDNERLDLLKTSEELRAKRNLVAEKVKKAGKPEKSLIEEGKRLKIELARREKYLAETEEKWLEALKLIPNMPIESVPVGASEDDNEIAVTVGDKPKFDFEPKTHSEIGEKLGWIDKKRAAKVAGARFAYLKGDLVKLEMALMRFGIDKLTDKKFMQSIVSENELKVSDNTFVPVLPPALAKTEVYDSTARLDKAETTYKLADDDLWLNASAEHTLAPMFSDEVLNEDNLPLRFVGFTTAFRREAGSYGKDQDGIIRMHQFNKLEMESFCTPETGVDEHLFMIAIQRKLVEMLKIPYRLIRKCTADIGGPNASGWDIDSWMSGQKAFRETHTADYMSDYQARRTNTKYRTSKGKNLLVHTNDATVFAERTLVAIIENYQQTDGKVKTPEVLKPYL